MKKTAPFRPVTWLIREIHTALRAAGDDALRPLEITPTQAAVLSSLEFSPGSSNAELARLSHVTPQSMVEVLKSLEASGLIVRDRADEGGRALPARLTRDGSKKLMAVRLAMRGLETRLLSGFGESDQERFREMLEQCLELLRSRNGNDL